MATERRTTAWLWVLFWLSLAGLIGAMAWGLLSYGGLQDRLADLPRAPVPGEVDVEVSESETLTVFYEDPASDATFMVLSSEANTLTGAPVELSVTGPSGAEIEIAPYERDLRFDYDDRVLIAMATIEAIDPGIYTVEASGDIVGSARISVGHIAEVGLVANVIGVVGLLLASVLGVAVATVLILVRRGRQASPARAERSLVEV